MRGKGFTLIEILIVISIIGVLAAIAVSTFANLQRNSRDAKRQADLAVVQSALEQYRADQGFYPSDSPFWLMPNGSITNCTGNPNPPCPVIPPTLPARTYLKVTPTDPNRSGVQYTYQAFPFNCNTQLGSQYCTNYCLYSAVENSANSSTFPLCTLPDYARYPYEVTAP